MSTHCIGFNVEIRKILCGKKCDLSFVSFVRPLHHFIKELSILVFLFTKTYILGTQWKCLGGLLLMNIDQPN